MTVKMTSAEVDAVAFNHIGKAGGYVAEEVDTFLDRVVATLRAWENEPTDSAVHLLAMAQQTADAVVADATARAEELTSRVSTETERELSAARAIAQREIESARAQIARERADAAAELATIRAEVEDFTAARDEYARRLRALANAALATLEDDAATAAPAPAPEAAPAEPAEEQHVEDQPAENGEPVEENHDGEQPSNWGWGH